MLELCDLHIGYSDDHHSHVVAGALNASLSCGQLVCLIGANGVGKSTLMRTMAAFQHPLRGQVFVEGRALGSYTAKELSRVVGVVLTEKNLQDDFTVEEVVAMGRSPYTNFWGSLTTTDCRVVDDSLSLVGLTALRHRKICRISDGERQKMMIAKVLAQCTPIILLDEPTAFLDYRSKVAMMQLLRRLAHEQNKLILLSTHDLEIAFQTADCLWLLQSSGLRTGTLDELSSDGSIASFLDSNELCYDVSERRIVLR